MGVFPVAFSHGPIARWVAQKLQVEAIEGIVEIDDPRAFADHMARSKNAIGFCAFGTIDFRMRCLTIDGEAPVISYVKYCAAKGAGTYGHYFETYPLLLPVNIPQGAAVKPFEPHQLRQLCFAGPTRLGSFFPGKDPKVAMQRPTNEVAPFIRDAGITVMALNGEVKPGCESEDCTDAAYLPGLLATGIDAVVSETMAADKDFARHSVSRLTLDQPIRRTVRGLGMAVIGGRVTATDLPALQTQVRQAKARGDLIAAALEASNEDFAKMAPALRSAGAIAVVNIANTKVEPWNLDDMGVIAPGLGAPFVPKREESVAALLVFSFYGDKFVSAEPIMVNSSNGSTRRLMGRRALDEMKRVIATAP